MTEQHVCSFEVENIQVIQQLSEDGVRFYRVSWPTPDGAYELAFSHTEFASLLSKVSDCYHFGEDS